MFTFPNFSQNDVQIAHDIAHCEFEPWYKVIIFFTMVPGEHTDIMDLVSSILGNHNVYIW